MHPRNPYAEKEPDFAELAAFYPALKRFLTRNRSIDFQSHEAVCTLTQALLARDFDLTITLSPDRLCPRVANRLNYILWIQDLLDSDLSRVPGAKASDEVLGLDIGTGASCIYPLLGCRLRKNWRFIASDIDSSAISSAAETVERNNFHSRISLIKTDPAGPFFDILDTSSSSPSSEAAPRFAFTMCNPPFYASITELTALRSLKASAPHSATVAYETELVTQGGELTFVLRMLHESIALSHKDSASRMTWYSSMFGKLDSVKGFVAELNNVGVANYVVAEFVQGPQTRRWAVAWRLGLYRASPALTRPGFSCSENSAEAVSAALKSFLPPSTGFIIPLPPPSDHPTSPAIVISTIRDFLEREYGASMHLSIPSASISPSITGSCPQGNIWARSFRRQKKRKRDDQPETQKDEDGDRLFMFRILGDEEDGVCRKVVVEWVYGAEGAVFESFCGMMKRLLSSILLE
ncbi:hypothetical protein BZA70DRAFT_281599 [Myxozyma melibiosi]|uniref:U6 small nuclear RNA (adenine-(43)-N(6))-methyltransferase n=1 Tax=Myxozyma melibiosi TaxID=54550 RepID=A0ABR1F2T5_9ASCO